MLVVRLVYCMLDQNVNVKAYIPLPGGRMATRSVVRHEKIPGGAAPL